MPWPTNIQTCPHFLGEILATAARSLSKDELRAIGDIGKDGGQFSCMRLQNPHIYMLCHRMWWKRCAI